MIQQPMLNLLRLMNSRKPDPMVDLPSKEQQLLYLGDNFGASISLDCARRIQYIDGRPGLSFIDIWILDGTGDTHIIRSQRTDMTALECRECLAYLTRQIGAFLFVNKDVKLKAPLRPSKPQEDDVVVSRHR